MLSATLKALFLFYLLEIDILTFVLVENFLSFSFTDVIVVGIILSIAVLLSSSAMHTIFLALETED